MDEQDLAQRLVDQLGPDQAQRYFAWHRGGRRHETVPLLIAQWVEDLERIVEDLKTKDAKSQLEGYFWIRLHGILTELKKHFARPLTWLGKPGADYPISRRIAEHCLGIVATVDAIQSRFDDDEIILIDYLRQSQVHVLQDGFELQGTKHGVLSFA